MGGNLPQCSAIEWMDQLKGTLALIWEIAVGKEQKAKDKMALRSEKNAKSRHYSKGDQVLLRVVDPGGNWVTDGKGPMKLSGR